MATVVPLAIPFTISPNGGSDMGTFVGADANGANIQAITGVTWPTVQPGDLAILLWTFQNTLTPTDPTSDTFTLVATADDPSARSRLLKRICDGTESGDISGWQCSAINRQSAVLYVVRGYSDVAGAVSFAETTTGTSHDCPQIGTGDGAANGDSIVVGVSERLTSGTTNATAPTTPVTFVEHATSEFGTGGSGGTYTGLADDGLATSQTMPFNPGAWTGHVSGGVAVTWTIALRPSGTLYTQNLAGSVSSSGVQVKQIGKTLAGSVSPVGDPNKQANKGVTGSATPAGSLLKTTNRTFAGSVTPASILANTLVRMLSLAGSMTPAGALLKQANRILSGSMTPAGALTKQTRRSLAGAITPNGTVANIKTILLSLVGAITPAGTLIRQAQQALGGAVAPAGALLKQTAKRFTGSVTPTGALAATRLAFLVVAGTVAPAGALAKRVAKTVTGTINPTGALLKLISRALGGTITPAGAGTHTIDIPQFNGSSRPTLTGLSSTATVTGLTRSTPAALLPEIIPFTIASGSATVTPAGRSTATVSDG